MNKSSTYLAVGISLAALSASAAGAAQRAAPNSAVMMSGVMRIAQEAGLPTAGVVVAQAPPTPSAAVAAIPTSNDVRIALRSLIEAARSTDGGIVESVLIAMKIDVPLKDITAKNIEKQSDDTCVRFFSVLSLAGEKRVQIDRYVKSEKRLYSYLLSVDGVLLKSTKTKRTKEGYFSEEIAVAEQDGSYQELLGFWIQYYRDNLKNSDQKVAQN